MGTSVRIAVIVPNVGMSNEEMEQRRKHLIRVCHPETSIHVCKNEVGPAAIESQGEHEEAAVEIVKQAVRLEKEGYQAVIPWCGGDPGLDQLLWELLQIGPLSHLAATEPDIGPVGDEEIQEVEAPSAACGTLVREGIKEGSLAISALADGRETGGWMMGAR